jgi:hypothetical protein
MEAKGAALRLGLLPAPHAPTAGKAIEEVVGGGLSVDDDNVQQARQELAMRTNKSIPSLLKLRSLRTNADACCDELLASSGH